MYIPKPSPCLEYTRWSIKICIFLRRVFHLEKTTATEGCAHKGEAEGLKVKIGFQWGEGRAHLEFSVRMDFSIGCCHIGWVPLRIVSPASL